MRALQPLNPAFGRSTLRTNQKIRHGVIAMKHFFSCSALVAGLFALELVPALAQTAPLELASPDHQLVRPLWHQAFSRGREAASSSIRLPSAASRSSTTPRSHSSLRDQPPLGSDVHIVDSNAGSGVDDYTLSNQKVSKVHDAYNSLVIHVRRERRRHRTMTIEARAYNDGFAFRYLLPAAGRGPAPAVAARRHGVSSEHGCHQLAARAAELSQQLRERVCAVAHLGAQQPGRRLQPLSHRPAAADARARRGVDGHRGSRSRRQHLDVRHQSLGQLGRSLVFRGSRLVSTIPTIAVEATLPCHSAWRVLRWLTIRAGWSSRRCNTI